MPGSGKTTLGTALYYDLREYQDNVIILDGDVLKHFVGDNVGYTISDRRYRAKKYSNICKILSDQGMCVIICTVAMFDEIREWNRDNIDGYIEIFLDVSFDTLRFRNKKGLYLGSSEDKVFAEMEFPKDADLVINNEGEESVSSYIEKIKKLSPRRLSDYDRDKNYWNDIYGGSIILCEPSPFAKSVISDILIRGGNVLDLGCGNGRDSLFFAKNGLKVTGIDASDITIKKLRDRYSESNAIFICDDFVKCKAVFRVMYDSIYSRFTLHAISEKQETELLDNIKSSLKANGRFYIEARSVHDDLYGLGKQVEKNAFVYNNHYRRFIDIAELLNKMKNMGYRIISSRESKGFSATKTQDPVLIRVIAEMESTAIE